MTAIEALVAIYEDIAESAEETSVYPASTTVDFESVAITVAFKEETIGWMDGQRICIDAMWSILNDLCGKHDVTPKRIVSNYEDGFIGLFL